MKLGNVAGMFLDIKKNLFEKGDHFDELGTMEIGAIVLVQLENVGQMGVDLVSNLTMFDL